MLHLTYVLLVESKEYKKDGIGFLRYGMISIMKLQNPFMAHTVVLIKILPYSGVTAQPRSAALWGISGSYWHAPAQQGTSTDYWCMASKWKA